MKHSFGAGIGLFLAFIGLYKTGIVTSSAAGAKPETLLLPSGVLGAPATPLRIGELHDPQVLLAVLGFLAIGLLLHHRVRGALLIGMALTAVAGGLLGVGQAPRAVAAWPFGADPGWGAVALQLDLAAVLRVSFFPVLLTLFLMSFLDTLGTLMAVGAAGGMLDEKGDFRQVERPMLVDALSCMFAGLAGTSTSGAYIESATGIREGARTGLAAVVTAALFVAALFFIPLVEPLQSLAYAYGPALIAVGALMLGSLARVDFDDWTETIPAFATVAMMVFTYNIANGLTAGLVLHPLMKLGAGRFSEVRPGGLVLAGLCLLYYLFGLLH